MTRAGQPPPGVAKGTSLPIERQQSYLCNPLAVAGEAGEGPQGYRRNPLDVAGEAGEGPQGYLRNPLDVAGEAGEGPQGYRGSPREAGRPDERTFWYCPVQCAECGAVVRAAKFSVQHTSVQWDDAAVRRCAEFARRTAAGEQTPLIERCEAMRASIDTAVREGRLPVTPP